jgi:hypothetical protein
MNNRLNSTALALIPLAIAINIAGGQLITALKLPIYLDSIGTVLTGVLLGPWVGLITGVLTNVIWGVSGLAPVALPFAPVAGIIGLMAGFAGRWGAFRATSPRILSAVIGAIFVFALSLFVLMFVNATPNPDGSLLLPVAGDLFANPTNLIIFLVALIAGAALGYFVIQNAGYAGLAGLITGVAAALVSAPIAAYVFGGVTGTGTDAIVAAFRASGANVLASAFAQGTVSDPFDKLTSFMIVWLIIQSLPQRLLARFSASQS